MGLISSLDCSGKPEVCWPMSETLTYAVLRVLLAGLGTKSEYRGGRRDCVWLLFF